MYFFFLSIYYILFVIFFFFFWSPVIPPPSTNSTTMVIISKSPRSLCVECRLKEGGRSFVVCRETINMGEGRCGPLPWKPSESSPTVVGPAEFWVNYRQSVWGLGKARMGRLCSSSVWWSHVSFLKRIFIDNR